MFLVNMYDMDLWEGGQMKKFLILSKPIFHFFLVQLRKIIVCPSGSRLEGLEKGFNVTLFTVFQIYKVPFHFCK